MKCWKQYLGVAVLGMTTSSIWAQVPPGTTPATPPAAAPAAPANIWNFFGINKTCLKDFKIRFCKSNLGLLMGNMMKPASAMSGGLLPQCCPRVLNDAALEKAAKEGPDAAKKDAQAAAAAIAKDEAEAKERRAAVSYLGTVDCHYWGDVAEPALIAALRTDRNECVRFEAALALGSGCCCTMNTISALTLTVYGVDIEVDKGAHMTVAGARNAEGKYAFEDKLGGKVETSERVKAAALAALQHCLSCYSETAAPLPERPEQPLPKKPEGLDKPVAKAPGIVQPAIYNQPVQARTMSQVIQDARQVTTTPTPMEGQMGMPRGNHTLFGVFSNAVVSDSPQTQGPAESPPASTPNPRYSGLIPWLTR
jgi:hypothetical protein